MQTTAKALRHIHKKCVAPMIRRVKAECSTASQVIAGPSTQQSDIVSSGNASSDVTARAGKRRIVTARAGKRRIVECTPVNYADRKGPPLI